MKKEYDFSNARPNPYAKKLKSQITINLDVEIGKELVTEQGNIHIKFDDSNEVTIPENKIDYPDNANAESDIKVQKTDGYYDKANNRLYFDVYVSTVNGTKDGEKISVSDILSVNNGATGISVSELVVDAVEKGWGSDSNSFNNGTPFTGYNVTKGTDKKDVTVSNLNELDKGECYHIKYYYELSSDIGSSTDFESAGNS